MGIWAIGAAAVLFISIRETILFKRKLLFCRLIPNDAIHQIVELRKQKEGIKKEIILLECDFIKVPMVFGFFNPSLLLPSQFMQHMDLDNLHSTTF